MSLRDCLRLQCPYCKKMMALLDSLPLTSKVVQIDAPKGSALRETLAKKLGGVTSVPQLFVGGEHIGGSDDAKIAVENGSLATELVSIAATLKNVSQVNAAATAAVEKWPDSSSAGTEKTVEWRIFTLPCVLSVMWAKFGAGVISCKYNIDTRNPYHNVISRETSE